MANPTVGHDHSSLSAVTGFAGHGRYEAGKQGVDGTFGAVGLCSLVGIIHSPLPKAGIALPGQVISQLPKGLEFQVQGPYHWAAAYGLVALLLLGLTLFRVPVRHDVEGLPAEQV